MRGLTAVLADFVAHPLRVRLGYEAVNRAHGLAESTRNAASSGALFVYADLECAFACSDWRVAVCASSPITHAANGPESAPRTRTACVTQRERCHHDLAFQASGVLLVPVSRSVLDFLGNCQLSAFVRDDGAVVWSCAPRIESSAGVLRTTTSRSFS